MNVVSRYLLRAFINHKIKRFGKMTSLNIDSRTKRIEITAELAGETEPLTIRATYAIEQTEEGLVLSPSNVETSREWMTELAREFLKTQAVRIPIPGGLPTAAVKILKL